MVVELFRRANSPPNLGGELVFRSSAVRALLLVSKNQKR